MKNFSKHVGSIQPLKINYKRMKMLLKILIGTIALALLIVIITTALIKPWLGEKIRAELNKENRNYEVEIEKVHILILRPGIELEGIKINSRPGDRGDRNIEGEIESAKLKRISLARIIIKKEFSIREVIIYNSRIKGKILFPRDTIPPLVSAMNIRIDKILFDKINLSMEGTSSALSYSVKEGYLKFYNLKVEKNDTLSNGIVSQFDFEAEELNSVSSDSLYSFTTGRLIYSATSNTLAINSFSVQPNYKDYEFTSRFEFQKSRIEATFSNIYFHNFLIADYFTSGSLVSSWIEIGKMDMNVFRDKRKKFAHINKPAFQDMIYSYPGTIRIDSIGLIKGNVTYVEHAEEANNPGVISFNEINARIYKITNDTIYKTESAFLELNADALLMGKGRMSILLKGRIFDRHNTFSMYGTLSDMEADELNPILEKNAFIYATSGKIDGMNFSFTADNTKATGRMTMLYHGLDLAFKNKRTDDTTAFRERFISFIANRRVPDSNPFRGQEVREGIIDYERDPERFLFHYCFRSILSGITSSLQKNPKK